MATEREQLVEVLRARYKRNGWTVTEAADGALHATGLGGVTWIGQVLTADDLRDQAIEERILEMAWRRMPAGGELCPLDLLPDPSCEAEVHELLDRIGLGDRPHVTVYARAA